MVYNFTVWGCLVAKWLKGWIDPEVPVSSSTIATGIFFHLGDYSALPQNSEKVYSEGIFT